MSWRNSYLAFAEAAVMARHNAQRARRMAKQWPAHAAQELADAREAYERGLRLLNEARWFLARAEQRANEEIVHDIAA